jgi:hypothetical protein
MDTSPVSFTCPHCVMTLTLEMGTWPYVYSQIVQHFGICSPEIRPEERAELSGRLADQVLEAFGGT